MLHPRPNPIIAAMYTLRDLDADIIVMHGPAGCGFMAARRLEEAGVRVMTTGMHENDLIFGAEEKLIRILKNVDGRFNPHLIGVVGTCASMIIGENLDGAVKKAGLSAVVLPVDVHGCSGPNTSGPSAPSRLQPRGRDNSQEMDRQRSMLLKVRDRAGAGLTSRITSSSIRATKMSVGLRIVNALRKGQRAAAAWNAKKEIIGGFADTMRAVQYARDKVGGGGPHRQPDPDVGLPRIRRYAINILRDLKGQGLRMSSHWLGRVPGAGEAAARAPDAATCASSPARRTRCPD